MDKFTLDKEKQYMIYGAGGNCYHVLDLLEKAGCSVGKIIDKRAKELGMVRNVPVVLPEDIVCENPQATVAIVTVKNVFDHTGIAIQLLKRGFCNLIYKPLPVLRGETDEVWDGISTIYEMLVEKKHFTENGVSEVPVSCSEHMEVLPERLPISGTEENMVCWMPVELLFNYDADDSYGKQHMAAFYPLVNLYSYLLGRGEGYSWEEVKDDYYLYSADWVKRNGLQYTDDLKQSQIESRVKIFQTMQKDAEINWNFFIENATEVTLGNQLHFYVSSSGRNRISFLVAKGYNYIPVKIDKRDYETWKNQVIYEEVKKLFEQWGVREVYADIPHPIFREYAVRRTDYSRLFCMPVISEIVHWLHRESETCVDGYARIDNLEFQKRKRECKVLVGVDDQGVLSRHLAMERLHSYRVFSEEHDRRITLQLDRLQSMESSEFLHNEEKESDVSQSSDVAILSGKYTKRAEMFDGELLFLMQEDEDNCLELWKGRGYRYNKQLFTTVWEGKVVRGYMLRREKNEEGYRVWSR